MTVVCLLLARTIPASVIDLCKKVLLKKFNTKYSGLLSCHIYRFLRTFLLYFKLEGMLGYSVFAFGSAALKIL